ncbi:MAG: hypothetical protein QM723_10605 [Myxococcaceae bacterium]
MLRAALWVAALALTGCPGSSAPMPSCPVRGGAGGGTGTSAVGVIGLVGTPMNVELAILLPLSCSGEPPAVSRVDVSVADPVNAVVASTASAPSQIGADARATITFTPTRPGRYHLVARFQPDLGSVQQDVLVALDKTGVAPNTIDVPALNCLQIDLSGDTLLCLDLVFYETWLRTIRAGQVVDSVRANAFALSQDRVWLQGADDQSVSLYQLEADGTLSATGSAAIAINGTPRIFASGDRALVVDMNSFIEVRFSPDAGFTLSPEIGLPPTNSGMGSGGQFVPDVGVTAVPTGAQVCSYSAAAGGFADAGCSPASLDVVGFDDDGVWWVNPLQLSPTPEGLFVTGWQTGQTQPLTAEIHHVEPLRVPTPASGQTTPQVSPMLLSGDGAGTQLFLPHLDGTEITLTRYPFPVSSAHADSKRIWFQDGNTITWYPR